MNKAREFEDFILDDYDYNLLEDWDLEYLWEWVEMDDFSDLQGDFGGGHGFDPDGAAEDIEEIEPPPEPPPTSISKANHMDELEDDEQEFLRSIGMFDEDENQDQPQETVSSAPPLVSDEEEEDDIDPFDISFDYGEETEEPQEEISGANKTMPSEENDDEGEDFLRSIGMYDDDETDDVSQDQSSSTASYQSENDDDDEGEDFLRSIGMYDEDEEETEYASDDDNQEMLGGSRYITTSAGTIDLELDDILSELQKVEFDEFIQVLTEHNHVYYKILSQRDWSPEEMDFLESIKPLIEDPDALQRAKGEAPPPAPSKPIANKLVNTRVYESAKEMFDDLSKKAEILAKNQKRKVIYTPKDMRKLWNLDNESLQERRIGLIFGKEITSIDKATLAPKMEISRNNMSSVIFGKNESRYQELKEIIRCEVEVMQQTLDSNAINFIVQDGKRFGLQFIEFLVTKYGTKIYYLYQSQLKNTALANRISADIADIMDQYLNPPDLKQFLLGFFEAIYLTLDDQGIAV